MRGIFVTRGGIRSRPIVETAMRFIGNLCAVPKLAAAFALGLGLMLARPVWAQGRSYLPTVIATHDCTVTVAAGASISAAIKNAPREAIICVRGGVYHEQLRLTSASNGLTLKAYPGERPILDGRGMLPEAQWGGLVQVTTANNITVDGFEVRNSARRGVVVGNLEGAAAATHNIIIRNMVVHHSEDAGIVVNGNTDLGVHRILIEGNTVYRNLQKNREEHTGGSALTFIQARDSVARGNTVYNNYGEGIVSGRYSTNIVLAGNISYDNAHANIYVINTIRPRVEGNLVFCTDNRAFWDGISGAGPAIAGVGLQLRDENFPDLPQQPPQSIGQVIVNNIVTGCGTNFGVATQVAGSGLVDAVVANNTFANARGETGAGVNNVRLEGRATFRDTLFANNILVQSTPGENVRLILALGNPDLTTFVVANNLYWPAPPPEDWYPNEPGRVLADPLLANPALPEQANLPDPRWFTLAPRSPAIDAGQVTADAITDFFGVERSVPPDLGAIEFPNSARPRR